MSADPQRIQALEQLVRELVRRYGLLCEEVAIQEGTTPEKMPALREDLALIQRAKQAVR